MSDGPGHLALGPRDQRDSGAPAGIDLSSHDWRALIEQLPLAVYIDRLDWSSSNVYTSPQLEAMLGYSAAEWAADPEFLAKVVHPEDRERVLAAHRRSCETGEPFAMEYRLVARDGRVVWFLDRATVVATAAGRPEFHHGFYLDITERKELEAALANGADELRRQKRYFESLLELSPVAIVMTDPQDVVTSWNPAAERLFGYTGAEAVGRRIDDLVASPAPLRAEAAAVTRDVVRQQRVRLVTQRTHKDGSLIDVDLLAAPVTVGGGQVGTYAIYHDVRDLKRSEAEVRRQKQYFESLVEISPTAIVTIGLDGRVTSWNPAAEELFGYTEREALGRDVDELVARAEAVRAEASDANERLRRGEHVHMTTRRTRKDGTLVDVDVRAAPIFVGARQVGLYVLYHDVGELLSARRAAEAATEAKSAFLATMSHEIRTPLNAVIGMNELLLGTELTPEQRELAEVARKSGEALLGVINDVLDFSKIEAGRLELEHRPLVVRDCIETALELVAAGAAAKGLEVACLVNPEVPGAIVGDSTRLRQILVNLLTNAVKFTERGEVVLTVAWQPGVLRLSVRDTGIGIPAERIDDLFESFSQVDASTTRRYGGTGLGLAISRRLCELMGGAMWVQSRPGKGSTFHFTIAAEAAPEPDAEPAAAELRGKRLLVVDDNAANREVVVRQARSWGMVPRDTGSAQQALEWIRRGDPLDVAVLDMEMPEMDGLALAREIRRYRDADALPLVMLTSLGRRAQERAAHGELAVFLAKPLKASQLYQAVVSALGATTAPAEAARSPEPGTAPGTPERLRVLVAEDNAVNQALVLRLLERLGYGADVAVNGVEALAALRRQPYDVVLMDVEMPEMDGLEAARRIHRGWPARARPRIVAMTANAMQGDREICLAAGMDDYVSKPVRLDALADALRRCVPLEAASPPAQDDGVLDPAALEQLCGQAGDDAFVVELLETFRRDAPALLETLRGALHEADAPRLRLAAHTLKSNARLFGATRLATFCRELEAMARAGALAGAPELVARVDEELARVAEALRATAQEAT